MSEELRCAFENCEREPVHVPGLIQPFGALVAADIATEVISHHSANLADSIGARASGPAPGATLCELLGRRATHDIRGLASLDTLASQRERLGIVDIAGRPVDLSLYRTGDRLVVEIEPPAATARSGSLLNRVRQMLAVTKAADGVQALLERAVDAVRDATGHDRVMTYRFLDGGDGEVLAEAKGVGIEPFLGLRYPAYDIPPQVRRIALLNPLRMIADTTAEPAALVSLVGDEPLDLSLCQLRGVSPVHVEYLTNMGVMSSLSLSIVVRGALWGLIACHHTRPRRLSADARALCELFAQFLSLELQQRIEGELLQSRLRAAAVRESLQTESSSSDSLGAIFPSLASALPSIVVHDGLALVERGTVRIAGHTLPSEQVLELVASVDDAIDIVAIDSLVALDDPGPAFRQAVECSTPMLGGALVMRFGLDTGTWLVLFRDEIMTEVRWGGLPEKRLSHGPNGPRLHPRGSFDEYRQTVRGRCAGWTAQQQAALAELRLVLMEAVIKLYAVGAGERDRHRRQSDLLIAELNHRVKNILALVQSVSRQTQDQSLSVETYAAALEKRIAALARAHEMVGTGGIHWAALRTMLQRELDPFVNASDDRILLQGPDCSLRGEIAPIAGLVLHELVTNSAKHGALSVTAGRVSVCWFARSGGLALRWREIDGPPITQPVHSGFGRSLIENAIAYECEGESQLRFAVTGLELDLWLPAKSVSIGDAAVDPIDPMQPDAEPAATRSANRLTADAAALVIEDNLLIAEGSKRLLGLLGFSHVDAAPNVPRALERIAATRYALALVDIDLRDATSFEAAAALQAAGVPMIFCTGYDPELPLPERFAGTPILAKPLTATALGDMVQRLLIERAGATVDD